MGTQPAPPTEFATPESERAQGARRFAGVSRLYGGAASARFAAAQVCVVGLGGVGSWVAEALVRSGIGALKLIDLDHVAESNVNRQAHALEDTLGMAKVSAMAARIMAINPHCRVIAVDAFVDADNVESLIGRDLDFVVDCIDHVRAKAALIAYCRANSIDLITCGAAGGQRDPTRIGVRDLARTEQEPLLAKVRKILRAQYGFPRGPKRKFHIEAVYSEEPLQYPEAASCDNGETAAARSGLSCAGFGSSVCVTASFGLVAASRVLAALAGSAVTEVEAQSASGALPGPQSDSTLG